MTAIEAARRSRVGFLLSLLLLAIFVAAGAEAELAGWEEMVLPAGGRLLVVDSETPGLMSLGCYFPAGSSQAPARPALVRMAPALFLGDRLEGASAETSLDDELRRLGWTRTERVDLEGAGVFLAGPAAGFDTVLRHLLSRLNHPAETDAAQLNAAWNKLRADWRQWGANPETGLRQEMAMMHYGDHPYGADLARRAPADARPPSLEDLRRWLDERYQAGVAQILVAGDLDPDAFLSRWLVDFDALTGRFLPRRELPRVEAGSGRLQAVSKTDQAHLILQFPGVAGDDEEAPVLALLAAVLQQFLASDMVGAGLAAGASAFFDYSAPGPRPLELQIRRFSPQSLPQVEARLHRILERMREGQFSEYQVISAKDFIFQSLDATGRAGDGPARKDASSLLNWNWSVLRQQLHFRRWRADFETRVLGTGKEPITKTARSKLWPERATFGLIMPGKELD